MTENRTIVRTRDALKLSPEAVRMLDDLGRGQNIAEPSNYPGSMAFGDHAIAYLSNAVGTCKDQGSDDFRVYSGLYQVRHGLELWLKCVNQNALLNRALRAIATDGNKFDDVVKAADQVDKWGEGKKHLQRALCVYRNAREDGLSAPASWHQNMDLASAERAITYMRAHGSQPRSYFAILWCPLVGGHKLLRLLERAKDHIADMDEHAGYVITVYGLSKPLGLADIVSACELFTGLDPEGDAFRYPTSRTGEWYLQIPPISLEALARLAQNLESTFSCYESLMNDAYEHATLATPFPWYPSLF